MKVCIKCEAGKLHPWHDDGTMNDRDIHHWMPEGQYGFNLSAQYREEA